MLLHHVVNRVQEGKCQCQSMTWSVPFEILYYSRSCRSSWVMKFSLTLVSPKAVVRLSCQILRRCLILSPLVMILFSSLMNGVSWVSVFYSSIAQLLLSVMLDRIVMNFCCFFMLSWFKRRLTRSHAVCMYFVTVSLHNENPCMMKVMKNACKNNSSSF